MSKRIVVFGANSAMAVACLRIWAAQGHRLYLVARDADRLERLAADLGVRGAASVSLMVADLADCEAHGALIRQVFESLGGVDVCLLAHGVLPEQSLCQQDQRQMIRQFQTNALSSMSLLGLMAERMEAARAGVMAAISSVAGDRGRASNYCYGASKAALTVFLQGLRNRLHRANVQVITIKPGFVDTPMTASFKKGALWAKPEDVAEQICKAIERRKPDVLYAPGFWRWIMWVICSIPESLFKRMRL